MIEAATSLADAVRRGERTARGVLEEHLERIEAVDPRLGSFLVVAAEAARRAADAVDARVARGEDPGPLAGVPLGIKDNLCWTGAPTTAGSRALEGIAPRSRPRPWSACSTPGRSRSAS